MSADAYFHELRSRHYCPRTVDNDLLYIPGLNAIYVAISKNACSLVKSELYRMAHGTARPEGVSPHNRREMGFLGPSDVPERQFLDWLLDERVFTFSFVRDPMERLVSCFRNRIRRLGAEPYDDPRPMRREWILNRQWALSEGGRRRIGYRRALNEDVSFECFVRAVCRQHPWEMDRHWVPQSRILARDLIRYDHIGNVGSLADGLARVAERTGAAAHYRFEGERLNASPANDPRPPALTPELERSVREVYRQDYELMDAVAAEFGA